MRAVRLIIIHLAVLAVFAGAAAPFEAAQRRGSEALETETSSLGPAMTEYMTFLDAEVAELTHLHDVGDVSVIDFRLSRNRLDATRDAALRISRTRKEDRVPELYILMDSELTQLFPSGAAAIRGKKAGDVVGDDFIYQGRIRKGVSFNILERVGSIPRATPY